MEEDLSFFDEVRPQSIPIQGHQNGRFAKGNQYWKNISIESLGRPNFFDSPEHMLSVAGEYLQWTIDNPLVENVVGGKDAKVVEVERMRVPTIEGFTSYVGCTHQTFVNYRKNSAYLGVMQLIENRFFSIAFEGASANLLNANIISRKLGLIDKKQVDSNINQRVLLYIPQVEAPKMLESGEIEDVDFENT